MAKKFDFEYDGQKIEVDQEVLTGAQIKAEIKKHFPEVDVTHELVLEAHGHDPDKQIADGDTVDLDHSHGGRKVFSIRPPTDFG